MDMAEMVDQLVEKRISDVVNEHLGSHGWCKQNIDSLMREALAQKLTEKIEAMKPELIKQAEDFLDSCDIKVAFGYRGLDIRVDRKEEAS